MSSVLDTAGQGILRLGMRLYAFELMEDDLVLRYLATSYARLEAIELRIGRPLCGLRASVADIPLANAVVRDRRILHRDDLDVFHSFVRQSTGFDPATLDATPETAGISNGVLAPLLVRGQPWGLLGVVSPTLTSDDAAAVALFATHVSSALEVAMSMEALEQANRELAKCNADLARAQQDLVERETLAALGQLAAVVAHEVRNPLCVLINSIGRLRDFVICGAPSSEFEDAELFASMATEEVNHLNGIVSDLIEFARPRPPDLRTASLVPVLESVAAATILDGRVCVAIAPDLPSVQVDAMFMQRALVNLVLNGLQATAKDGTVKLSASREHWRGCPCVRVDVADDGLGIPANVRESIFEPFFTTKASGTGLGLTVVKRIVDCHGGELTVESSMKGTLFTVRLPAADELS
ncbi:MAG TPA: ATP-binding protein [Labilithrix sp.]|nr:ATP-binding protein [Labilithrix sp.]